MESLTIVIAGQPYTIGRLTIGQLSDLHVGVFRTPSSDPQEDARALWNQNIGLIAAALSVDHPDMTAEAVSKLRFGTVKAAKEAVNSILNFAGLVDDKEPKQGEVPASAE